MANRVTINGQHYDSPDAMPPEVRKLYDNALKAADPRAVTTHPRTRFHVSVNFGGSQAPTLDDSAKSRTPPSLPVEDSSLEAKIRSLPVSLAILIGIALILWAFLR